MFILSIRVPLILRIVVILKRALDHVHQHLPYGLLFLCQVNTCLSDLCHWILLWYPHLLCSIRTNTIQLFLKYRLCWTFAWYLRAYGCTSHCKMSLLLGACRLRSLRPWWGLRTLLRLWTCLWWGWVVLNWIKQCIRLSLSLIDLVLLLRWDWTDALTHLSIPESWWRFGLVNDIFTFRDMPGSGS